MKIAILDLPKESKTLPGLKYVAEKRGHSIESVTVDFLQINDLKNDETVNHLSQFDLVFIRSRSLYGLIYTKLISILRSRGVYVINGDLLDQQHNDDKIFQFLYVNSSYLKLPKTYVSKRSKADFHKLSETLGCPYVAKTSRGGEGKGVALIKSPEDHSIFVKKHNKKRVLFQEFIPNSGDYRVLIIGGTVGAIYKRIAPQGQFLNNVTQGGRGEAVSDAHLISLLSQSATEVAKNLGLEVAGIDIMQSDINGDLYFIEANKSPVWLVADEITGIDINKKFIDFFERAKASS